VFCVCVVFVVCSVSVFRLVFVCVFRVWVLCVCFGFVIWGFVGVSCGYSFGILCSCVMSLHARDMHGPYT